MSYLTRDRAVKALTRMHDFHDSLESVFALHKLPLRDNLGRRNIIMSQAQEEFFAQELAKDYDGVESDGRTGQPDILVGELGRELECKLASRGVTGQIGFQCDENTMAAKGKLDFLYVVASEDFKEFAVLHFIDLTPDDFFPASSGSKGRARMKKWSAMKKCNVVLGDVVNLTEQRAQNIRQEILEEKVKHARKISEIQEKFSVTTDRAIRRREQLQAMAQRENHRYAKKMERLENRLVKCLNENSSYSINMEKIPVYNI